MIFDLFKKNCPYNKEYEETYDKKKQELDYYADDIQTLILGSSHGLYAYRATLNEFNLCLTSQDLYYSYKLYEKYSKLPNLKNIVLFYSVFSPSYILQKTAEKERAIYYKIFFNIPLYYLEYDLLFKIFLYPFKEKIKQKIVFNNGNEDKYWFFEKNDDILKKRVKSHIKNNLRDNIQLKWINKLLNLSYLRKQKVFLIVSPASTSYKKLINKELNVFKDLENLSRKYKKDNFKIIDLYNSDLFDDTDFGDYDHLNQLGAEKLTEIVRRYIND